MTDAERTQLDTFLRFKVLEGFRRNGYPMTPEYLERIDYELSIISEMNFTTYFLIVADLCRFMREAGIRFLVRGSGCGSCVVWGLGISHAWLDPVQYGLPFERFLNPHRVSNPDLDMDIQDDRRAEVVQYTVDRYGAAQVARIITFGTMGPKAAIKDVARALELPDYQSLGEEISRLIPLTCKDLEEALEEIPELAPLQRQYPELFALATRLVGRVRHASIHAAGTIISPAPMNEFMPSFYAKKPESRKDSDWFPTTQWDMYNCEDRGLLKMDYLGLKTLRVVDLTVKAINHILGALGQEPTFDIDQIDRQDPKAWALLAAGKTAGVFQIENPFVRAFARRMKLERADPWQLAILVSIIRPGMMDCGATEHYLLRAAGQEEPVPMHPLLAETLKSNFQMMVFQEDTMHACVDMAGMSMAEADTVRRGIGKKKPEILAKMKPKFIAGSLTKGATEAEAEEVWSQMETFGRYGFNNAHAAAYGCVLSYQTAYLKANWTLPYMTFLINSETGSTSVDDGYNYKVAEYVEEARNIGLTVLPPCVKRSQRLCNMHWHSQSIRFGLQMVKGVSTRAVEWILTHTRHADSFKEFALACYETECAGPPAVKGEKPQWRVLTRVGKNDLEGLITAGAFDLFEPDRLKLAAMAPTVMKLAKRYHEQDCKGKCGCRIRKTAPMVREALEAYYLEDDAAPAPQSLEVKLDAERRVTGCFLSDSPFTPYRAMVAQNVTMSPASLAARTMIPVPMVLVGMATKVREIIVKKGRSKGKAMAFLGFSGTDGDCEVTVFSDVWGRVAAQRMPDNSEMIAKGKVYLIQVSYDKRGDGLICDDIVRLSNTGHAG
jgi:DNA polymerase III subunit alpha